MCGPFTWQRLCENISLDPHTESHHLPRPLRDLYITKHIHAESCEKAAAELRKLRGAPAVTCRLTLEQNRQLLTVAYWNILAPFDATLGHVCKLVRFRFMLHGYTAREIGGYRQTALHLGHGANIRVFKNKPQYRRENLKPVVLNSIYKSDGTLMGSGFKGTRGKYGHPNFAKYEPRKRMKRSRVQEMMMRTLPQNIFSEYKHTRGAGAAILPTAL